MKLTFSYKQILLNYLLEKKKSWKTANTWILLYRRMRVNNDRIVIFGWLTLLTSKYKLSGFQPNSWTGLGITKVPPGFVCGFNSSCWYLSTKACSCKQDPNRRCSTSCNLKLKMSKISELRLYRCRQKEKHKKSYELFCNS